MTEPFSGTGISLRPEFLDFADDLRSRVDCVEILEDALEPPGAIADLVRRWGVPFAVHCLSLSPARADFAVNEPTARRLSRADRAGAAVVSDHLSFSEVGEYSVANFFPAAKTPAEATRIAANIRCLAQAAGVDFAVENPVTFFDHPNDEMSEADFLSQVAQRAGCGLLLDVNNLYINAVNRSFDPAAFIDRLDGSTVRYLHVAGHDAGPGFLVDSHAAPVAAPVWDLTEYALRRTSARAAVLERDNHSASPAELVAELETLRDVWRSARREVPQ